MNVLQSLQSAIGMCLMKAVVLLPLLDHLELLRETLHK